MENIRYKNWNENINCHCLQVYCYLHRKFKSISKQIGTSQRGMQHICWWIKSTVFLTVAIRNIEWKSITHRAANPKVIHEWAMYKSLQKTLLNVSKDKLFLSRWKYIFCFSVRWPNSVIVSSLQLLPGKGSAFWVKILMEQFMGIYMIILKLIQRRKSQ